MVLTIQAGAKAYQHIRENGLSPADVTAIYGASGAAKWLSIYGLDRAIFSDWLPHSSQLVDLFGTSVGAFKLAAATQRDPVAALLNLADAYIDQDYKNGSTAKQVVKETNKIIDIVLSEQGVDDLLNNTRLRYHCASVRCLGGLASDQSAPQKIAMVKGFLQALAGRAYLRSSLERIIFHTGVSPSAINGRDQFFTQSVTLDKHNLHSAILSSGSIPVVMAGVDNICGAPAGVYRDGGLLDYHANPANIGCRDGGIVLYPHFYPHLKECWFDKFFAWRKVSATQLDNVVLVSPSESFVCSLPGGRISERQDFQRFRGRDQVRVQRWNEVKERSLELGAAFLAIVNSGDIAAVLKPIE